MPQVSSKVPIASVFWLGGRLTCVHSTSAVSLIVVDRPFLHPPRNSFSFSFSFLSHFLPCRNVSSRFVGVGVVSGVAPQQPEHRREMCDEEDVGARGGNTAGPRERPAGDEPPALTTENKLVRTQDG